MHLEESSLKLQVGTNQLDVRKLTIEEERTSISKIYSLINIKKKPFKSFKVINYIFYYSFTTKPAKVSGKK
jgi:hypothetical protein